MIFFAIKRKNYDKMLFSRQHLQQNIRTIIDFLVFFRNFATYMITNNNYKI